MSSETVWELSDTLWGSAAEIVPGGGSVNNTLFGFLSIPSVLTYFVSEVLWGFGA